MQEFPHHYAVTVAGAVQGDVELTGERLPTLGSASPAEFDGPGDRWSPETLPLRQQHHGARGLSHVAVYNGSERMSHETPAARRRAFAFRVAGERHPVGGR